jgi:hypothetical protein
MHGTEAGPQQNIFSLEASLALVQVMHAPAFCAEFPVLLLPCLRTSPYLTPTLLRRLPNLETEAFKYLLLFPAKFFFIVRWRSG